ncbi:MAG: glycosyltransferase [Peptococcaceae bacterium]|nr:glycosyltransferase [Peptococcaceae bacterium]
MDGPGVLQVIRPAGGGMVNHVRLLLEGLVRRGFATAVACPGDAGEELAAAGVPVYPLFLTGEMSWAHDLVDIWRLSLILRSGAFDLVHAHGLKAATVTLAAARLAGRVRTVYTAHGATPVLDGSWEHLRLRAAGGLLRRYDCVVAVSQHTRRTVSTALGLDPSQVRVIYNGIEVPRVIPPRGAPGGCPVVGMVARLAPRKGVEVFLQAARLILREFPRTRFLVAGDGPLWPQLKQLAESLGLSGHVLFTGRLREAAGLMPFLDVFALPSLQEDLPLALLEAMARGRPVVAARTGGVAEVVSEGTGILVPPGDAGALAAQVGRLLGDRGLAERLGRAARRSVLLRFDVRRMQDETTALYQGLRAGDMGLAGVRGA